MNELLDMVNKRDFADVIKLRLLRWEIILDYLGLALNAITRAFIRQAGVLERCDREIDQI